MHQHRHLMRPVTFILLFNLLASNVWSQFDSFQDWNNSRLNHQNTAMIVLGSWAVINIAGGLILQSRSEGELKYFHQMNAGWNIVNAGISGMSLIRSLKEKSQSSNFNNSVQKLEGFQRALLFNAGLDVGYMLGGMYLIERSNRQLNPDRLRGFGKSVVLQGAFLFVFDLAAYFTSRKFNRHILPTFNTSAEGTIEFGLRMSIN
jgi:hypothetical protein